MKTRIFLVLVAAATVASAAPKALTTDTLWDWRTVGDPQISRDGKAVVYTLGWNDKMNDAMYSNLWVASTDGRDQRPLTQGNFRDTSPRWSPDDTRLAYLSNRSGKVQIHVRWVDTGQDARITDLEQPPANIAWSPDGKWLLYSSRVPARPAWRVDMPSPPPGAKWAEPPTVVTRLRWRADGAGLIQPGTIHIFIIPSVGGAPRQITSGDFDHIGGAGGGRSGGGPAWSADGEWILSACRRTPDADYSLDGGDIYAFRVKDGMVRQLTTRRGPDSNPTPSPDGKKIAYTGYDFQHQSYTVSKLYVMNIDGSNQRCLTEKLDRDVTHPRWAADSSGVYFIADDRGAAHLYLARLDGAVKPITSGRQRFSSGYAESDGFTIAANGRVAITRSSPLEPSDVVTFPVDQPARVTRLTASNDALLASYKLGEVEELTYDSFDGRAIQGWIVNPPDFDPSKKYPFILDIHGGPHSMYGVEFNHQRQVFAARGFVVLYTNPRGSTGYGEEFGNIIHTNYPGDDFKDLMIGVDVTLKKGYVDEKRLAVTGGSGGGLLTAWIIGHTDRFAAAVSQYPVTNWITQAGTADGGYYHAAVWMKSMPWENPQQYMEHSPIFFAKNFRTPTMVITGEADLRTPMAESEELYFALKARKVDAVLVRIPDEPHGIRGQHPSHRIWKMEHVLGWISKYTK
ncbi:MAG: S9 family peptidase [Acidobacteria bacterium]|nr:S9 family peptidase [Acidobacteriota bacterium]